VRCIILYNNRIASNYIISIIIRCINMGICMCIYTCVECDTGILMFVKIL
jgi:hypothetical protein